MPDLPPEQTPPQPPQRPPEHNPQPDVQPSPPLPPEVDHGNDEPLIPDHHIDDEGPSLQDG